MLNVKHRSIEELPYALQTQQMLDAPQLAEWLMRAMAEVGLTSAELARRCEVSPQAVYEWRRTGRIHKKHLPALAAALSLPLSDLFREHPPTRTAEPGAATLRYALHASYPDLTEDDVERILAYAAGIADTRHRS